MDKKARLRLLRNMVKHYNNPPHYTPSNRKHKTVRKAEEQMK